MRHIPNILSVIRILMVGVFIGCFTAGRFIAALSVYVFAFLTDVLDGGLARRFHWVSNLGKLLDPFADKLMTVSALTCIYLGKRETVYLVLFLAMAVKELLMLVGALLMARKRIVAVADGAGKLATGLFAVGIVLTLLSFAEMAVEPWNLVILIAAAILSYLAMIHYAYSQFSGIFGKRLP